MISILQSLSKTIHLSIVLTILLFLGLFFSGGDWTFDQLFWSWLFRYFHVLAGVMWIGLLWYLNFVQIPSMPKLTDEQKRARLWSTLNVEASKIKHKVRVDLGVVF